MARPTLGVFKFASCDGCQLSLLDAEDELLAIAGEIHIANFVEASREVVEGPYDLSLVEGSITTAHDAERIHDVREQSKFLVTIGACATSGGIQALRNFADVDEYTSIVYAHPESVASIDRRSNRVSSGGTPDETRSRGESIDTTEYISTLATSTAIGDHVPVDFELRGCPINKHQLIEVVGAFLKRRTPAIPTFSVCVECKRRGTTCIMVADGIPCMGPITQAGCGAICPAYDRGCYGCFGPMESPNVEALGAWWEQLGVGRRDLADALRTFNANAPAFRKASEDLLRTVAGPERDSRRP